MRAMILNQVKMPLVMADVPIPEPGQGEVLIKVVACGVCRTDLHVRDGELPNPTLPLILGHQVVGTIVKVGPGVDRFQVGERVGCPWLGKSCGTCPYCRSHQENLCDHGVYRGYQLNGGFAEYCLGDASFIFSLPDHYSSEEAAPLLCAGLIGYRSYRMLGDGSKIGFYGFGAAAHILIQIARHQGKKVFAFTRKGDAKGKAFAKEMGAFWVGDADERPPEELDGVIIFAPAGELVPIALQAIRKGGVVVCAGIYMTDIPSFPYHLLYGERVLRSVTNLTREDAHEFFQLASSFKIETRITLYPLEKANEAMDDLKAGKLAGSAILVL